MVHPVDRAHTSGMTRGRSSPLASVVASVGLAVLSCAIAAAPASASCAAAPQDFLPHAANVLRASVIDSRPGFVHVEVTEIWRGAATRPRIWVQTGEDRPVWPLSLIQPVTVSSTDASLTVGTEYVIAADRRFRTNSCQIMDATNAVQLGLRPTAPIQPAANGHDGADLPLNRAVPTIAAVALLAASAIVIKIRRRPHPIHNTGSTSSSVDPDNLA